MGFRLYPRPRGTRNQPKTLNLPGLLQRWSQVGSDPEAAQGKSHRFSVHWRRNSCIKTPFLSSKNPVTPQIFGTWSIPSTSTSSSRGRTLNPITKAKLQGLQTLHIQPLPKHSRGRIPAGNARQTHPKHPTNAGPAAWPCYQLPIGNCMRGARQRCRSCAIPSPGRAARPHAGNGSCRPGPDGRRIKPPLRKARGCVEDPWREQTCSGISPARFGCPGMDPGWNIPGCAARSRREANLALLPPTLEVLSPSRPLPKKSVQSRLLFTRALVIINNSSAPWCSSFPELPGSIPPGPVI